MTCSSMSQVAESAHCMSSSTMTSGRAAAASRRYSTISSNSVYLLPLGVARGARRAAGTSRGSSRHSRCANDAELLDRGDDLGPRRVRRLHVGLAAPPGDERAGAEAHFAAETADERRFADARFADDGRRGAVRSSSVASSSAMRRCISSSRPTNCLRLIAGSCDGCFALRRRDDRVAAAALRFVQRAVGGLEQRVEVAVLRPRAGDTDRERHRDRARALAQRNRRRGARWRECVPPARAASSTGVCGSRIDELVAGVSADDARRRGELAQRARDDAQHGVALQVAVRVVDVLELVDVDDDQRDRRERTALGEDLVRRSRRTAGASAGR